MKSLTVAITGMNARADNPGPGLAVARCLREEERFQGNIIGLSYDALDPGLYLEEMCEASFLLPYPSAGETALLQRMQEIHADTPFDVLIPCLDAELLSMVHLKDAFAAMGIKMLLPDSEQLEYRNKDKLPQLGQDIDIKIPELKNITHAGFFYQCTQEGWHYPLVVKGLFYDAAVVHSADEAAAAFHKIAASWGLPVLVQRFIEGEEVNLSTVGDGQGNMLAPVSMRKRALTDKNKAWAGMTVDDPKVVEAAEKIIRHIKWPGPLEVEMMIGRDGHYYLIEINPRFPAWIYLSKAVGCNLPYILLELITGNTPEATQTPKAGSMFIRYAQEVVISLSDFEQMTMYGHYKGEKDHD
ncbi:MAG: ATP-grasp domain-containing protein [Mariprofundaceae bacterium]|nr:ATP-grasp domain-containing protein [Mariprofundaceae bacterium]